MVFLPVALPFTVHHNEKGPFSWVISPLLYQNRVNCITSDTVYIVNYLAHAYLSFNQPAVVVGNLISDYIKGKKQFDYPDDIRHGIVLHRAIDTFTDEHPVIKTAKEIFRPHYRLYSGAFIDVVL